MGGQEITKEYSAAPHFQVRSKRCRFSSAVEQRFCNIVIQDKMAFCNGMRIFRQFPDDKKITRAIYCRQESASYRCVPDGCGSEFMMIRLTLESGID
jgi:hypothetical protein